jgi:hypothetical protein
MEDSLELSGLVESTPPNGKAKIPQKYRKRLALELYKETQREAARQEALAAEARRLVAEARKLAIEQRKAELARRMRGKSVLTQLAQKIGCVDVAVVIKQKLVCDGCGKHIGLRYVVCSGKCFVATLEKQREVMLKLLKRDDLPLDHDTVLEPYQKYVAPWVPCGQWDAMSYWLKKHELWVKLNFSSYQAAVAPKPRRNKDQRLRDYEYAQMRLAESYDHAIRSWTR